MLSEAVAPGGGASAGPKPGLHGCLSRWRLSSPSRARATASPLLDTEHKQPSGDWTFPVSLKVRLPRNEVWGDGSQTRLPAATTQGAGVTGLRDDPDAQPAQT